MCSLGRQWLKTPLLSLDAIQAPRVSLPTSLQSSRGPSRKLQAPPTSKIWLSEAAALGLILLPTQQAVGLPARSSNASSCNPEKNSVLLQVLPRAAGPRSAQWFLSSCALRSQTLTLQAIGHERSSSEPVRVALMNTASDASCESKPVTF